MYDKYNECNEHNEDDKCNDDECNKSNKNQWLMSLMMSSALKMSWYKLSEGEIWEV